MVANYFDRLHHKMAFPIEMIRTKLPPEPKPKVATLYGAAGQKLKRRQRLKKQREARALVARLKENHG